MMARHAPNLDRRESVKARDKDLDLDLHRCRGRGGRIRQTVIRNPVPILLLG